MELKQLQYFVTCAETQSFRKAANLLYTTQSNVSKTIKALEQELGQTLFLRNQTGVILTERGKQIYEYANATLDSADRIMRMSEQDTRTELRIMTNPSSWMANAFCQYYREYASPSVSYTFLTSNTPGIINSLTAETASLAFIYVMEQQLPFLERQLSSNHLTFSELGRMEAVLYLGAGYQEPAEVSDEQEEIALIQGYEDEFTLRSFWNSTKLYEDTQRRYRVAVTTNSDYLMNEMLDNTSLGNISTGYLSNREEAVHRPAVSLYGDEQPVLFGCLFRNDRPLSNETKHFLKFIKNRMKE